MKRALIFRYWIQPIHKSILWWSWILINTKTHLIFFLACLSCCVIAVTQHLLLSLPVLDTIRCFFSCLTPSITSHYHHFPTLSTTSLITICHPPPSVSLSNNIHHFRHPTTSAARQPPLLSRLPPGTIAAVTIPFQTCSHFSKQIHHTIFLRSHF